MAKKRTSSSESLFAKPQPSPGDGASPPHGDEASRPPPRRLQYLPLAHNDKWAVEQFDLLAAEMFEGQPANGWEARMQQFHEFAQAHAKGWLIARRIFGVAPLYPGPDTHPDEMKCHTREEVVAAGIVPDKAALQAELEALRTLFHERFPAEIAAGEPVVEAARELLLDDTLLEKFHFSKSMFQVVGVNREGEETGRPQEENRAEQAWFCEQLRYEKWAKMLVHRIYGDLARDALMNLLYLRRVQKEMGPLSTTHPRFQVLNQQKASFSKAYQAQMEDLQSKFPELAIAGDQSFHGTVSDLMLAQRQYYASNGGDNRLINKFCTALEMQWMLRQAVQRPASLSYARAAVVVEACNGIYQPEFRSRFKPAELKILDGGARGFMDAARQILNEPVVDLARGVNPDEPDQFPDFKTSGDGADTNSTN